MHVCNCKCWNSRDLDIQLNLNTSSPQSLSLQHLWEKISAPRVNVADDLWFTAAAVLPADVELFCLMISAADRSLWKGLEHTNTPPSKNGNHSPEEIRLNHEHRGCLKTQWHYKRIMSAEKKPPLTPKQKQRPAVCPSRRSSASSTHASVQQSLLKAFQTELQTMV